MSTTRTIQKWLARILDLNNAWTEKEIIYFRKALRTDSEGILLRAFYRTVPADGYAITSEQSEKGTQYLLSKSLKKNGQARKGNKLRGSELTILQDPAVSHRLVGLHSPYGQNYYLPIYRATDSQGYSFDYVGATYSLVEVLSNNYISRAS